MPDGSLIYYVNDNKSLSSPTINPNMKNVFTKVLPNECSHDKSYYIALQVFVYAACVLCVMVIFALIFACGHACYEDCNCCKKYTSDDVEMNEITI